MRLSGLPGFTLVWIGQLISVLATQMSAFALSVWVYERTGSATALGLTQTFALAPLLVLSPIAGALVDRYDRKLMMAVSDLAGGLGTLGIVVLQAAGQLEVWHLFSAAFLQGLGNAFQFPAYSAAISVMVPREQLGRANGMMSLVEAGPAVLAPLAAGALLPVIGLTGLLLADVATFGMAVASLLLVRIPRPAVSAAGEAARSSLPAEAVFGFRYIFSRPSLLGLQLTFLAGNLMFGMAAMLAQPFVLARTGNDELTLGLVMSVEAIGGVVGAIAMSVWGGFKRRIHGIFGGWLVIAIGMAVFGLSAGPPGWAVGAVLVFSVGPVMNASSQTIWQSKVEYDVQGRVFSARRLISWLTTPIAPPIAGLLADTLMEPALRTAGNPLADLAGPLVGLGPGSGMAVLFLIFSALTALVGLVGYSLPVVREIETRLPDVSR